MKQMLVVVLVMALVAGCAGIEAETVTEPEEDLSKLPDLDYTSMFDLLDLMEQSYEQGLAPLEIEGMLDKIDQVKERMEEELLKPAHRKTMSINAKYGDTIKEQPAISLLWEDVNRLMWCMEGMDGECAPELEGAEPPDPKDFSMDVAREAYYILGQFLYLFVEPDREKAEKFLVDTWYERENDSVISAVGDYVGNYQHQIWLSEVDKRLCRLPAIDKAIMPEAAVEYVQEINRTINYKLDEGLLQEFIQWGKNECGNKHLKADILRLEQSHQEGDNDTIRKLICDLMLVAFGKYLDLPVQPWDGHIYHNESQLIQKELGWGEEEHEISVKNAETYVDVYYEVYDIITEATFDRLFGE